MPYLPFSWISVSDLCLIWSKESGLDPDILERALCEWYQGCIGELTGGEGILDIEIFEALEKGDQEGITGETPIPRDYVLIFAREGKLTPPSFWNEDESKCEPPKTGGRPTFRKLYARQFEKAVRGGKVTRDMTVKQVANFLHKQDGRAKPKTIEGYISPLLAAFKSTGKLENSE